MLRAAEAGSVNDVTRFHINAVEDRQSCLSGQA
jgi:hypothetical protein